MRKLMDWLQEVTGILLATLLIGMIIFLMVAQL